MRIYIAKKDIEAGRTHHCGECPIALALKRRVKHFNLYVGLTCVEIFSDHRHSKVYTVSKKGQKFIQDFDGKKDVKPFHLYLKFSQELS